jgi:hypothetical protein
LTRRPTGREKPKIVLHVVQGRIHHIEECIICGAERLANDLKYPIAIDAATAPVVAGSARVANKNIIA